MNRLNKILIIVLSFFAFFLNVDAYNKAIVDITTMDIYEIQDAIDKGYLTYELLAKLYLDRIEAYDKDFNTIITLNENIIEEAKEKDLEYQRNGRDSILFGIPILVKDNIDVKGFPTTAGTKSLNDNYPKEDAEIIKNLKDKGILIIGKTNMSEFSFQASSSISSYGTTKNAYNTYFSSYGSSGGTAVGVSLQFALLGIGTDTNASLRVPASANNVIGFRPTLGLLSNKGIINYDITRDTAGPITKTVEENAIMLAVMEDLDENTYIKDLNKLDLSKIKIGVIDDFLYGNDSGLDVTKKTYTEIENLMKNSLEVLEHNNVEIVHLKDFYKEEYSNVDYKTLGGWTMCYAFNNYIEDSPSKIKSFYDLTISNGHINNLWDYLLDCKIDIDKINTYQTIKEDYDNYIKNLFKEKSLDYLVYPTTKNRLLKVNEDRNNLITPSFTISSVLGYPAVNVSIGNDADGLYYGMEILSLKNSEESLYKFIYQYEKINSHYELSALAPPLYSLKEEVIQLLKLYEKNRTIKIFVNNNATKYKEYKEIEEQVENYIFNYNDLTDDEVNEIDTLLNNYKNITMEVQSSINVSILTIVFPMVALLAFIQTIFRKKKKK